MEYHFTPAFYLQFLPGLFALILIFVLWKRRKVQGVVYLILFEFSTAIWGVADALEHAAGILSTKIFWSQFALLGASTIPPFFLLFTLIYYHHGNFPGRKTMYLLFLVPLINLGLSLTNRFHHLVWEKVELIAGNGSVYYYGPWFWLYVTFELGISVLAVGFLVSYTIRFYKIYKRQIVYLILATILPFFACLAYVFKLTPLNADLTPLSLTLVGIFVAIGIFSQGMLYIMPVAHEQIIEHLSDGILVINMADRIIDANPGMSSITGVNSKDLIGKSFHKLKSKLLLPFLSDTEKRASTEVILSTPDGKRNFEITCNPVNYNNQQLIGKIFIFHDITKRINALNSAIQSNSLLTKEISEKEKLILDLDAYARSVAHDLKNPITGLLGVREIVKDKLVNKNFEGADEILNMAHVQCSKMYRIVDDLLLLSRIRKEDFVPEILNMADILKESIKRLNGLIPRNNNCIQFPDSWPQVVGHPKWIEEVWYNLLRNAIKYGGNPPIINIDYYKSEDYFYCFRIQDNGNGLPQESLKKLFGDFERLNYKNKEGHGLGLSIVKRIVEKLGGVVTVTSENIPGEGCIFSFTLKGKEKS